MLKLLIMSDIHYGSKYSLFDFEIIENELPNFIVLNGDIVDVPNLKLFAEFINEYASYFPISKTCILLGDNEYLNDSLSIAKYAKNLEIMNKELSFFTIGNMFFSDLLPAWKGEGSLRTDHRFVVYHLHPHHFIISGNYPSHSIHSAVDHELDLQPITPIPHQEFPILLDLRDSGIYFWFPHMGTRFIFYII